MHVQMFVETLVISSSFLTIAIVLVASVLILEKKADYIACRQFNPLR
jgi:hypothetical protein